MSERRRLLGIGLAVAVAYAIGARFGFRLAFVAEQITTVWPPTGLAVAALLLWGRSLWPAVWLGAFVANAATGAPLWTAPLIATGNTLEAVVATRVLQTLVGFDPALRRVRDAVGFIIVAGFLSTAISATVGVTTLCAASVQPWVRFPALWSDWWLGDALGALVVAPVILTTARTADWSRRSGIEAVLLVVGAAATSQAVFGQALVATIGRHPLEYVIFAFVIAAAVRLGQPTTALVVLGASIVTIWNTVRGAGPFAGAQVHDSLILLQAFMGMLAGTGLLLASAIAEQQGSERRTRAILDTAADAIIGMDHQGLVTEFNPSAERMFGYRREQALGQELAELLLPRGLREQHRGGLARYLATGEGPLIDRRMETTGQHADGREFPVEVAFTRLSGDGPPRFTGFVRDLTAQADAEREREQLLQREQKALRETERQKEFLYSLFMQAPTLIAVLRGADHIVELANPPMRELWGHTEGDLRDRPLFEALPELQEQAFKRLLDEVYRTGNPYLGRETPVTFDRRGGAVETVYLNFVYSALRNVQEEIEGIVVIASDVSDQVKARRQVDHLREQADAANRAKDEFLATLSHELRTPLSAIVGWARLLLEGELDGRSARHALEVIDRNAQLQVRLVADILDVSRIISGGLRLDIQPVDLGAVIGAALDVVRPAAEAKKIRIKPRLASSARITKGDAQRLQQIVWNLLINAIKFTPAGGLVDVDLLDVEAHGAVAIRVKDNGAGIDPTFLPYVFERFRQADGSATRQHQGLGLGLAIVRHLVELHGGTIRAESEGLEKGATFTVELPRMDPVENQPVEARDRTPSHESVSLGGCRALVVDDEEDTRELIATILTRAGATVQTASSAHEALRHLEESRPDVLLSDIGMPGTDGYALIREARRRDAQSLRHLPAAAITAYAGDQDRERALAAGFDRLVPKPISPAAILEAVRSMYAGSHERP